MAMPVTVRPTHLRMLEPVIRAAWCGATSASVAWNEAVPSKGQCAVTALVLQDYLGGDLVRAVVCSESHYWNRVPDVGDVDLTADQFPVYEVEGPAEVRTRAYVLSSPYTRRRYELLRSRVEERL